MTGRRVPGALWRLATASDNGWHIQWHPQGFWSAERREGSVIRYLCGIDQAELADLVDAAERRAGR